MPRRSLVLVPVVLATIAGCAAPPATPASRASAAALASCRANTESSFNRQNRYLLSERNTTRLAVLDVRRRRDHHAGTDASDTTTTRSLPVCLAASRARLAADSSLRQPAAAHVDTSGPVF